MIVTFYSYKGGVGRSMALVNVGEYLARQGVPVILVDWDLEAPGLERFFEGWQAEAEEQPGVVDLLLGYRQAMAKPPQLSRKELATGGLRVPARDLGRTLGFASPRQHLLDLSKSLGLASGTLRFLPAGRREGNHFTEYAANVKAFDWAGFYRDWEGEVYLEWFRQELLAESAVVLIDSRTGVTEIGGVCVYQLADVVVMLCAANQNNLAGTISMAEAFSRPVVRELRGGRPLRVLPVPARIPAVEETEQTNLFLNEFSESLGSYYRKLGLAPDAARRFLIPQIALYSFRERVAVRETGSSRFRRDDLTAAYREIATTLAALAPADNVLARRLPPGGAPASPPEQDDASILVADQEGDKEAKQRAEHAFRRRLRVAALAWEAQEPARLLLRGAELADAEAKLQEQPESFLPEETRFIAASREFQRRRQHREKRILEIAAVLLLVLVVGLSAFEWQKAQRRREQALRLESWGLPRDLAALVGQLNVLKLPSSVNRVDWLEDAGSLQRLDLSGTNVVDLAGTPPSLVDLNISATPVAELRSLPPTLRELSLGYTTIRSLPELPASIRRLDLTDMSIESIAELPSQLSSLTLDARRLKALPDFPKTLQSLVLSNYQGTRLPPLPPSLRSLSLVGTGIRSLAGIPSFLESLTLINNADLALTGFSPSLDTLRVDLAPTHLSLERLPRALSILELRRVPVDYSMGLPGGLRELTLVESPIADVSRLPSSLRSLTLGPEEQSLVRDLPEGLRALTLSWSQGVEFRRLPRSLKSLDLSLSRISSLAELPENLETLVLNGTNVSRLKNLPPRLRKLEVSWTKIDRISDLPQTLKVLDLSGCREITNLSGLPPLLEELSISNTGVSSLAGLPNSLRRLDIRGAKIRSIRSGLPPNLEVLRLNPLQIREIGSLPRSLRELYFDEPPRQP